MMDRRRYEIDDIAQAFAVGREDVRHLGTGAFGETWWVRHRDGTETACKIIFKDGYSAQRLEREIAGLSRVSSPRVVRLYRRNELEVGGKSRPVLQFEYVHGGDLAHFIQVGQRPNRDEIVALLRGLLEGVQALHEGEVVHRDIKPHNIALRDGSFSEPVILDLGLARPLDASTMTRYPGFIGTLPYMAPEQLRGEKARLAADLYAVGIVVVEAFTGRHPYIAPDDTFDDIEHAAEQLAARQERLKIGFPSEVPDSLVAVLEKLTSPKPHQRSVPSRLLKRLNEVA
ncbi:serine/threonine-protein kinase [Saccharothrix variisporea]|uniref:non-specific serine/threonine protein kinase n=1 Tax=Saccharothrix variisporea TaxID=543527 RepID=A0A495XJM6_9PSEU|nr:serine/threonine-protein kinase [Saccharothrix variisporea]RKT72633.1 protein kinase-like protein [Saccharothrix variisporea]